jgi:hypothetical protein
MSFRLPAWFGRVHLVAVVLAVTGWTAACGTAASESPNSASRNPPSVRAVQHALSQGPFRVVRMHGPPPVPVPHGERMPEFVLLAVPVVGKQANGADGGQIWVVEYPTAAEAESARRKAGRNLHQAGVVTGASTAGHLLILSTSYTVRARAAIRAAISRVASIGVQG